MILLSRVSLLGLREGASGVVSVCPYLVDCEVVVEKGQLHKAEMLPLSLSASPQEE